jgi:hypothetical protein
VIDARPEKSKPSNPVTALMAGDRVPSRTSIVGRSINVSYASRI